MIFLHIVEHTPVKNSRGRKGKNKKLPCMTGSILLKYEKFIQDTKEGKG